MARLEVICKVEIGDMNPLPEGWRFRSNWRGKLILQRRYEHYFAADGSGHSFSEPRWRDATISDFSNLLFVTGN